jgi:hypothetical protein
MMIWGYDYNWEITPDIWKITINSVEYTRDKNKDVA